MKNFAKIFLLALPLLVIFLQPAIAKAAGPYCYCALDLSAATADQIKVTSDTVCPAKSNDECNTYAAVLVTQGKVNFVCSPAADLNICKAQSDSWKKERNIKAADLQANAEQAAKDKNATKSQIIPACALSDKIGADCLDVTIFVQLMLNIVNYLLSFVGGLALLFLVYGGFVLIFSGGAPDKITQGKDIIMAAAIGLVVSFCGYVLVSYLGYAVGISSTYALQ